MQQLTAKHVRRWHLHRGGRWGYGHVYQGRYQSFPVEEEGAGEKEREWFLRWSSYGYTSTNDVTTQNTTQEDYDYQYESSETHNADGTISRNHSAINNVSGSLVGSSTHDWSWSYEGSCGSGSGSGSASGDSSSWSSNWSHSYDETVNYPGFYSGAYYPSYGYGYGYGSGGGYAGDEPLGDDFGGARGTSSGGGQTLLPKVSVATAEPIPQNPKPPKYFSYLPPGPAGYQGIGSMAHAIDRARIDKANAVLDELRAALDAATVNLTPAERAQARSELEGLISIAVSTPAQWRIDDCYRWAEEVGEQFGVAATRAFTVLGAGWTSAIPIPESWTFTSWTWKGHDAFVVRLSDGTVFYLANGKWGHAFQQKDIPWWVSREY